MHELPAIAVFFEQLGGVLSGVHHPEDIHLVTDILRICFLHQEVEQSAIAMGSEFVAMRVIEKFHPLFRQYFTGLVENGNSIPAGLLIESSLMRNPRAADVFKPEHFGFTRYPFGVVAEFVERIMSAGNL